MRGPFTLTRSPHKRPIEPRGFSVTGRVKEQIRAGWQVGQGKQIHQVAVRQISAVLHDEVAAQHAIQSEQRIASERRLILTHPGSSNE